MMTLKDWLKIDVNGELALWHVNLPIQLTMITECLSRNTLRKKSSVMTNRKSTTHFSVGLRRTEYIASKPPKGG